MEVMELRFMNYIHDELIMFFFICDIEISRYFLKYRHCCFVFVNLVMILILILFNFLDFILHKFYFSSRIFLIAFVLTLCLCFAIFAVNLILIPRKLISKKDLTLSCHGLPMKKHRAFIMTDKGSWIARIFVHLFTSLWISLTYFMTS